jgi:hypothetical protein
VSSALPFVAGALALAVGNAIRERGIRRSVGDLREVVTRVKDDH